MMRRDADRKVENKMGNKEEKSLVATMMESLILSYGQKFSLGFIIIENAQGEAEHILSGNGASKFKEENLMPEMLVMNTVAALSQSGYADEDIAECLEVIADAVREGLHHDYCEQGVGHKPIVTGGQNKH